MTLVMKQYLLYPRFIGKDGDFAKRSQSEYTTWKRVGHLIIILPSTLYRGDKTGPLHIPGFHILLSARAKVPLDMKVETPKGPKHKKCKSEQSRRATAGVFGSV